VVASRHITRASWAQIADSALLCQGTPQTISRIRIDQLCVPWPNTRMRPLPV
jgi:hypothetical protein